MPRFTDFFTDFEKKNPTFLQSRIVESTRNAFISFNSAINFIQFLYKNVQLTNKIVFAFNKKIRSTFVKYAPSPPPKKKQKKIPVAKIIKFTVSAQEASCQNYFSSPLHVRKFCFWTVDLLVQDFFSYPYGLAGCFFQITHPLTA